MSVKDYNDLPANTFISFKGNGNIIKFSESVDVMIRLIISIEGDNCIFEIGHSFSCENLSVKFEKGSNQYFRIGSKTRIRGANINLMGNNAGVMIGDNCLFSTAIAISTTDWHSVIDKDTKKY